MRFVFALSAFLWASSVTLAQTASLRGRVTDESGAIVSRATVTLSGTSGLLKTTTTSIDGGYFFTGLAPGNYSVQASAPDLSMAQPVSVALRTGVRTLDLQLRVASTVQQVTVEENAAPVVTVDPAANASALVMTGDDLLALADDPDDLQADLQALAGPSAGPGGGSIMVDGFSGADIPPKSSIREVRINQNPFSPEYDTLGYGHIEIFTKPGAERLHGEAFYNFGDSAWNSRDPYARQKAPFLLKEYGGNISGPMGKRASLFLDLQRHSIDNGSIINAITLDPQALTAVPYTDVHRTPQRRLIAASRVDYQLSHANTLTVRYSFARTDIRDAGIGGFNLISQGTHNHRTGQAMNITETAVLGANLINEMRFQLYNSDNSWIGNSANPMIQVLGSFNGGGSSVGRSFNTQRFYEFQNYTSLNHGVHSWRFGVRLRGQTIDDSSPHNFAGAFTFGGGAAPVLDANNQPVPDPSGQPLLAPITSIERYRRTLLFQQMGLSSALIRALGGGATQFSLNAGNPLISAGQMDAGLFVGDDWRARPNLTFSYGLRYETQTNIHDWRDFAPRLAIAWSPGARSPNARAKNVLRAGFGFFYDRFSLSNTVTAQRYNGLVQQQYIITNPDFFPVVPSISALAGFQSGQTDQQVSATLRAPYTMQSSLGFERQLPLHTTLAVTYVNAHGLHLLRSRNINAPLPGTYDANVPGSGAFPRGAPGPLFLMESSGLYNQNQLIAQINSRMSRNISWFGSYTLNRAMSNTDGLGTFPANPYSFAGDYGPAAADVRHRVNMGGTITAKWDIRLSPLFTITSGPPFDVTVGRDLYGDTLFNGRPGIAADPGKPGLIWTRYGLLDPNPSPGEKTLPRNYGRGPGAILVNMRLGKTFAFGPAREDPAARRSGSAGAASPANSPASRRYNLAISLAVRNIINHTNPGPIIGNITSPLFGQANQTAGANSFGGTGFSENANNRRLEFQARLTF